MPAFNTEATEKAERGNGGGMSTRRSDSDATCFCEVLKKVNLPRSVTLREVCLERQNLHRKLIFLRFQREGKEVVLETLNSEWEMNAEIICSTGLGAREGPLPGLRGPGAREIGPRLAFLSPGGRRGEKRGGRKNLFFPFPKNLSRRPKSEISPNALNRY